MTDRIDTLVLSGNGAGLSAIAVDTLLRSLFGLRRRVRCPRRLAAHTFFRNLSIVLAADRYASLSYVKDWEQALAEHPRLATRHINANDLFALAAARRAVRTAPLVIVLHSATGDDMRTMDLLRGPLADRRGKLAVFVGNEYNAMHRKIGFLKAVEADFICSQLPLATARWLYADCTRSTVLPMPHALNPALYRPGAKEPVRDMGFIGSYYPLFIGDEERTAFIEAVRTACPAHGLRFDFRGEKVDRHEWAAFLAATRAVPGAEAGSRYLDREGTIVNRAAAYMERHPDATLDELRSAVFDKPLPPHRSGKALSSRHLEPAGTMTCQVLLEGDYNGVLRPGEHYIEVKRDLSNLDQALERVADRNHAAAVARRAHEHVMRHHTYAKRVDALLHALSGTQADAAAGGMVR